MTTRADVNRLTAAQRRLVEMARADMARLFRGLDLSRPERSRDALLEIVPALVREYGELAAVVAAEWYEELRAKEVGGTFAARLGEVTPVEASTASVKYAAGHLFTDNPTQAMAVLSGSLQRHVLYSGRDTVTRNVSLDPAKPRYGRVPTGSKTCAWCSILASRGFVYHSKAAAGDMNHYHDACNCAVVVEFDAEQHHIDGYDPDAMYDRYNAARNESGSGDINEIAATLRRLYPDDYKDGVHTH